LVMMMFENPNGRYETRIPLNHSCLFKNAFVVGAPTRPVQTASRHKRQRSKRPRSGARKGVAEAHSRVVKARGLVRNGLHQPRAKHQQQITSGQLQLKRQQVHQAKTRCRSPRSQPGKAKDGSVDAYGQAQGVPERRASARQLREKASAATHRQRRRSVRRVTAFSALRQRKKRPQRYAQANPPSPRAKP